MYINSYIQLCRKPREKKIRKNNRNPALEGCPHKKGTCLKIFTVTPRKPNSAIRRVAKLRLTNRRKVTGYISGIGFNSLVQHSLVMIRGGRTRDIPGITYRILRGKFDFLPVKVRVHSRSKYGVKRPKI
jgi:small subunit ribosomal protein S12